MMVEIMWVRRRQHKDVRLRARHELSTGSVDSAGQRGPCLASPIPNTGATMRVAQIIETKLTQALRPTALVVTDESARHAGHAGAREGGETHFHVDIVSAEFVGKSRVARQRLVYQLLAEELNGPIHALSLTTKTPQEEQG